MKKTNIGNIEITDPEPEMMISSKPLSNERLKNSLIDRDLKDIDRDLLSPGEFVKLYPVEDLSYPEPEKKFIDAYLIDDTTVILDGVKMSIPGIPGESMEIIATSDQSIIKEPGRARKIYNKLRGFLK